MRILSRFIIIIYAFLVTQSTNATDQLQHCSIATPCPNGLACVGAIGEGEGVCVMTGPQIVLCKVVDYFDDKLVNVFAIFAVVMIGIAFFLGKISWGMILSVIIGIGIIKGSTSIIKKVSGEDDGYCSATVLDYSSLIGTDCIVDDIIKKNTNKVYNTLAQGELCQESLTCVRQICTTTNASGGTLYIVSDGTHTREPLSIGEKVYLPEHVSNITVTTCSWSQFQNPDNNCTASSISCTLESQSPNKDYFRCKNTCIGTSFTRYYNAGEYENCKEIGVAEDAA